MMKINLKELIEMSKDGSSKTFQVHEFELSDKDILAIGDRYFELKQDSAKDSMIQKEL